MSLLTLNNDSEVSIAVALGDKPQVNMDVLYRKDPMRSHHGAFSNLTPDQARKIATMLNTAADLSEGEERVSHTLTIELEDACGEDIDVDRVSEVLRGMDIKVIGSMPGSHLLSRAALMRARESVDLAVAMVLGYEEGTDDSG